MIEVLFDKRSRVTSAWVRRVVAGALAAEKKKRVSVGIRVLDDRGIRRLNKKHLRHDYATDVISFGLDEPGVLGDLAVSEETAVRTAVELGLPFRQEMARYLVHGVLHLLGYDDKRPADRKRMHARQEAILRKIGIR